MYLFFPRFPIRITLQLETSNSSNLPLPHCLWLSLTGHVSLVLITSRDPRSKSLWNLSQIFQLFIRFYTKFLTQLEKKSRTLKNRNRVYLSNNRCRFFFFFKKTQSYGFDKISIRKENIKDCLWRKGNTLIKKVLRCTCTKGKGVCYIGAVYVYVECTEVEIRELFFSLVLLRHPLWWTVSYAYGFLSLYLRLDYKKTPIRVFCYERLGYLPNTLKSSIKLICIVNGIYDLDPNTIYDKVGWIWTHPTLDGSELKQVSFLHTLQELRPGEPRTVQWDYRQRSNRSWTRRRP